MNYNKKTEMLFTLSIYLLIHSFIYIFSFPPIYTYLFYLTPFIYLVVCYTAVTSEYPLWGSMKSYLMLHFTFCICFFTNWWNYIKHTGLGCHVLVNPLGIWTHAHTVYSLPFDKIDTVQKSAMIKSSLFVL